MKTTTSSRIQRYLIRIAILLIMVALIAGMAGCVSVDRPATNATEIWNWYDLAAISNNVSRDYLLMTNLNSATAGYMELASSIANGGKGWQPIATGTFFGGLFDGQGYEIGDLVINRPDKDFVGLFSLTNVFGIIRNVGVVNATVTGRLYVGGLMGANWRHVLNCYFRGNVTGSQYVGGLAGVNGDASNITSSYATGNVAGDERIGGLVGNNQGTVSSSYSTSTVTGNYLVGGLLGISFNITSKCYATGNVTGSQRVGGLLGSNQGTVSGSYSTGNVTGNSSVGGLVGYSSGASTVVNSFWDTETSGQITSDGGTGRTTAEMQDIATFSGATWDIVAVANPSARNLSYIWNIVDDETYPFLSWES